MKLRQLKYQDIDRILCWMHDESINQFFANDFKHFVEEDVREFIDNCNEDSKNIHYACVDENNNYLGTISLKNIDVKNKNAEYAISFCKFAHGTGAAKFATEKILKIAFEELGLEKVYLNVLTENIRANKFYKKIGFIFEGKFEKHICINGVFKDLNWYRLLKDEYFKIIQK